MPAGADPEGYVLVANASAGTSERAIIHRVAGRLAEDAPTEVVWVDGEDSLDDAIGGLAGRRLVVAGGDGTLHVALNRLAANGALDAPVAIVPAGTGNDLARGIGLGTDPLAAADLAIGGTPRWLAAIEVSDGELAHNNVHVGLGLVAAERGSAWKPRLHRLAYPVATVVEGIRYDGVEVAVEVDGEPVYEGRALAVLVLLGPSMGGGIEVAGDVQVDEPQLDVVVVDPSGGAARLGMAYSALRDRLADRPDVGRWTATRVHLGTSGELRGDVDGEIRSWRSGVGLTVRPRTWQVLGPDTARHRIRSRAR